MEKNFITYLKDHFAIHFFIPPLHTKLFDIFMSTGPHRSIMIMCKRNITVSFPLKRYQQKCSICRQNEITAHNPMDHWNNTFWSITRQRNVSFTWNFGFRLLLWLPVDSNIYMAMKKFGSQIALCYDLRVDAGLRQF